MAIQFSTAVRNAMLEAIEATIGASAVLCLYSGAVPASPAAGIGASLELARFSLAADWASDASGGVMALAGLPLTTTGEAAAGAGTACTYYRFWDSTVTTCHEQGTVTNPGLGGDLTLDNTSIASGQTVNIVTFSKTAPGA